jgi:hypothetical protein
MVKINLLTDEGYVSLAHGRIGLGFIYNIIITITFSLSNFYVEES